MRQRKQHYAKRQLAKRNYIENGVGVITSSKGNKFIVDVDVFSLVSSYLWTENRGYAKAYIDGKMVRLHKFITPDEWGMVDHIDRNNLRRADKALNSCNATLPVRNLPRGVYRRGTRFSAQLTVNGRRHNLGSHGTVAEAQDAVHAFACSVGRGEYYPSSETAHA